MCAHATHNEPTAYYKLQRVYATNLHKESAEYYKLRRTSATKKLPGHCKLPCDYDAPGDMIIIIPHIHKFQR